MLIRKWTQGCYYSKTQTFQQHQALDDVDNDVDPNVPLDSIQPGDAASGSPEVTICIERWKNTGPDERKRMWHMFVEAGVFVAVCQHGFLLVLCDMIQSGELSVIHHYHVFNSDSVI